MAKKTNKTSHVLNLITGSQTSPEEAESTQPAQASSTPAASGAAPVPASAPAPSNVTVVDTADDEALSDTIKQNLLQELEKETASAQADGETQEPPETDKTAETSEPEKTAGPEEIPEQPEAAASEEPAEKPVTEPESEPETGTESVSAAEPETPEKEKPPVPAPLSFRVLNVMEEILTPEVTLEMMQKNDVCHCPRCQADVRALMLTRLQPKYVVAERAAIPMLMTYYRNKFRVAILSQSLRACIDVKENPRH